MKSNAFEAAFYNNTNLSLFPPFAIHLPLFTPAHHIFSNHHRTQHSPLLILLLFTHHTSHPRRLLTIICSHPHWAHSSFYTSLLTNHRDVLTFLLTSLLARLITFLLSTLRTFTHSSTHPSTHPSVLPLDLYSCLK